jgi:putative DNA primase/helicase
VWDGHRWRNEDTLAATDLIRSVCRHDRRCAPTTRKVAAKLASSGTVGGVERLGACGPQACSHHRRVGC